MFDPLIVEFGLGRNYICMSRYLVYLHLDMITNVSH